MKLSTLVPPRRSRKRRRQDVAAVVLQRRQRCRRRRRGAVFNRATDRIQTFVLKDRPIRTSQRCEYNSQQKLRCLKLFAFCRVDSYTQMANFGQSRTAYNDQILSIKIGPITKLEISTQHNALL